MAVPKSDIIAAGALVFRPGPRSRSGREVLLVHRPKYDDWSFPKGKRDRGELTTVAAVREVAEETGLSVRLGRPLSSQRYSTSRGMKQVFYWIGRVRPDCSVQVEDYQPNDEIDQVAWVPLAEAATRLTYPHDVETLREARARAKRTETLVVVRHGSSRARSTWRTDDALRPLLAAGRSQAQHLVPALAAYGVQRLVTSPSVRCVDTLAPYAEAAGLDLELEPLLSEEGAEPARTREAVRALVGRTPVALCSHRPVLGEVARALGAVDPGLDKGEVWIVHLRKGAVVATELLR